MTYYGEYCQYCGREFESEKERILVPRDFSVKDDDEEITSEWICHGCAVPWELMQLRIAIRSLFEKEVGH